MNTPENSNTPSPGAPVGVASQVSDPHYWDSRYKNADSPWDLGHAHPAILQWLKTSSAISGRILVPGCGPGHDVIEIAHQLLNQKIAHEVIGVDFSETIIKQAKAANTTHTASYLLLDFLSETTRKKHELENFDLLIEHTCFCAIAPTQRPNYAKTAAQALKPGARFFGIFFLDENEIGGPPWTTHPQEFHDLFTPHFEILTQIPCTQALSQHRLPETLVELRRRP
ncbi:MAG: methyltransferase domain-containing protein [Chthoniobacterales bacterium]